jgi:hypothetical protein
MTVGVWLSADADAPINYGDQPGDTVTFLQVTESSFTDSLPLYGTPTVIGDTLLFALPGFGSYSSGGTSDLTDGTLDTTIVADSGSYIGYIRFREYGDVSLSGTGTSSTYAAVANSIFLQILEIDETPIIPITTSVNTAFTPSDGDWNLADDGVQSGALWQGELYVDITGLLTSSGKTGHATKVKLIMDNVLNTGSEAGTSAYIRKKATDGIQITPLEEIPEPATFLILGVGGGFLTLIRKRRKV